MKKRNNNTTGKLPKTIKAKVIESFKTIDFESLWIWIRQKGLTLKVNDDFETPSIEQLKAMAELTIKQYYLYKLDGSTYIYLDNMYIDKLPFIAGFAITLKDWYFGIDFEIQEYDERREEYYVESYNEEVKQITRLN